MIKSVSKQVKLIIPPVMKHDKIKTDGYGMALIALLIFVGLLNVCNKHGKTYGKTCDSYREHRCQLFCIISQCSSSDTISSLLSF